jgi:TDG/mug DNA glycosylase family protein
MESKTGQIGRKRKCDSSKLNPQAINPAKLGAGAVPDLLRPGLTILFIGINPGLTSGATGHHFAGRSNRFWRFLAETGLTPVKYRPEQDFQLLALGYGITNIVPRVTATAAELTPAELRAGAARLLTVLTEYRPMVAAYLGKVVYQYVVSSHKLEWGRQALPAVAGVNDFVMPNPSGLNRMPIPEQLRLYLQLREMVVTIQG